MGLESAQPAPEKPHPAGRRKGLADRVTEEICKDENSITAQKVCRGKEFPPEQRKQFLPSMRGMDAFTKFGELLSEKLDLSERKLTVLYPGAGDHIAPLFLASSMIDKGFIDEAVFTYTDLHMDELLKLQGNLILLSQVNAEFKVLDEQVVYEASESKVVRLRMSYKGKNITIDFGINVGEDGFWFQREDAEKSSVLICHDPGQAMIHAMPVLQVLYQFLQAPRMTPSFPQFILLEDLTAFKIAKYQPRRFDLELLGKYERGHEDYGHRDDEEVGESEWRGGLILQVYPEIMALSNEAKKALMGVDLIANDWVYGFYKDSEVYRDIKETKDFLFTPDNLENMVREVPDILETLKKIDPKLARGFAIRVVQALYSFGYLDHGLYLFQYLKVKSPKGILDLRNLLKLARSYFAPVDEKKLGEYVNLLDSILNKLPLFYPQWLLQSELFEKARGLTEWHRQTRAKVEDSLDKLCTDLFGKYKKRGDKIVKEIKVYGDRIFY